MVQLVIYFASILIGPPYFLSMSSRVAVISLEFPYKAHLEETDGTGLSIAKRVHPAKKSSSLK